MEIRVFNVVSSLLGRRTVSFGYQTPDMSVALKLENLAYLAQNLRIEKARLARTNGREEAEVVFQQDVTRVAPPYLPQECHFPLSSDEESELRQLLDAAS